MAGSQDLGQGLGLGFYCSSFFSVARQILQQLLLLLLLPCGSSFFRVARLRHACCSVDSARSTTTMAAGASRYEPLRAVR